MQSNIKSKLIKWWMTPKLPDHDIYELPLLIDKTGAKEIKHIFSQWLIHPIKRRLARVYLKILQRFTGIVVIGITGSAGKTTTKEMLYSILKLKGKTVCSKGFVDPVYNIPNTILSTPPDTKYLILEMGVEYPGEMDYYLWLAQPNVGVITNIFPTHAEFFINEEGVYNEKSKLVKSIQKGGMAILNSNDSLLKRLKGKLTADIIWFKTDTDPLVQNANAASEVAKYLNTDENTIKKGIKNYNPPEHRLSEINLKSGARILDDSYNSNLNAAISTLNFFNLNFKGRKICILGEMRELGNLTESSHRTLGRAVAKSNFEYVICIGDSMKFLIEEVRKNSKQTKTYLVKDQDEIVETVEPLLKNNTSLLVKGARSLRLDKVVARLS